MGTYGGKERATANHRSSKRRRNSQNWAWHGKKRVWGKQNITWDQIKRHIYNIETMSDHYRRHMLNRTDRKEMKNWCNSLYIFTLPITIQKYYSLPFRRTQLLQSLQMPHGSEILYILLHKKSVLPTPFWIVNHRKLYDSYTLFLGLLNLYKQTLPCCGSSCISLQVNISSKMMKYGSTISNMVNLIHSRRFNVISLVFVGMFNV